jgi:hypothetical protein
MPGDPMSWWVYYPIEEPVKAPKIVRVYKPQTDQEPEPPAIIAFVGDAAMPVFRGPLLHPYHIAYLSPQQGLPVGCLLIGPKVDIVACAWTCSLTATDRAMLEGMKITPNFIPNALTEPVK